MKYEYLSTEIRPNPGIDAKLNELGERGWQIVAVSNGQYVIMRLKGNRGSKEK